MDSRAPHDAPKGSGDSPESRRGPQGPDLEKRRTPLGGGEGRPGPGTSTVHPVLWIVLLLAVAATIVILLQRGSMTVEYEPFFWTQLEQDNLKKIQVKGNEISGEFREETVYARPDSQTEKTIREFRVHVPTVDEVNRVLQRIDQINEEQADLANRQAPVVESIDMTAGANVTLWLVVLLPTLLFFGLLYVMMRRARDQFDGGILGNFVRSPAKRADKTKHTTFDQVAGLENAKNELQEIVEFLKNPEKFQRLGGRIPKGVLLVGPPGTGKTLLARAVAGEAGVPFYSISGSEFIQMFVGVGASRVRDMFKNAKENSPCILFIDEIDAVGRIRGAGLGGGHDEREQTLNQILTEMDGFSPNESVIVLAATNRPDVLDPALLRPGRFDRHVEVGRPSKKGRLEILKVHTRQVPLDEHVDLERIASGTVGMSGADLANLVNEAALMATRQDKDQVDMNDFDQARDKILIGAKREDILTETEKRLTAFHEAGHALVAWLNPNADPLHKVTIIPRGRTGGVTMFLPEEDRITYTRSKVLANIEITMGGRAAEQLVFGEVTSGAQADIDHATRLARMMVTKWGMSDRLGPVSHGSSEEHPFLGREISETRREHSEHTAQIIDEEIGRIITDSEQRALSLLRNNRDKLDSLSEVLIEREVLSDDEIRDLIGDQASKTHQSSESNGAMRTPPTVPVGANDNGIDPDHHHGHDDPN